MVKLNIQAACCLICYNPIPHPDHIQIDLGTRRALEADPFTKEEKAALEMWEEGKAHCLQKIEDLRQDLENIELAVDREVLQAELRIAENLVKKIRMIAPD